MNSRLQSRFTTLCLIAASTTTLVAQDLRGTVSVDLNANRAYYVYDISGPPNGTCFSLFSFQLSPQPIVIPGLLHDLLLDPFLGAPLHVFPLGPLGGGLDQFPVPLPLAQGLPLMMQAVVLDPARSTLAFTDLAVAVPFVHPIGTGVASDYNNGVYTVRTTGYAPGSTIEVSKNGGPPTTGTVDQNREGQVAVPMPGGPQRGDVITVKVNGITVATWNH